jgi:glutamine amidotransferase
LPDIARVTTTRAMLCAVRSASVGTDTGASAAAPYTDGNWLFSLNGALLGWSAAAGGPTTPRRRTAAAARAETAGEPLTEPSPAPPPRTEEAAAAVMRLAGRLSVPELLALQARCDSALLWGLVLSRLRAGETAAVALARTVSDIWAAGGTGRFNLLLTDGTVVAATAAGDSLCYRSRGDGVIVASEPFDDEQDWHTVPDGSVVQATTTGVTVRPIAPAEQPGHFAPAANAGHANGRRQA